MANKNNLKITKNLQKRELTLERIIHAPRELAWKGWTEQEHIARWWGPKHWTTTVLKMDVRPGGIWHFRMQPDDGQGDEVWGRAVYHEVIAPSRLVYTEGFSDAEGNVANANQQTVTVEFVEIDGATTKITISMQFTTIAGLDAVEKMGMIEGYGMALDRLEALMLNRVL